MQVAIVVFFRCTNCAVVMLQHVLMLMSANLAVFELRLN